MNPPRVIHVRLFRRRFWEAFERDGVEPFYLEKRQAVDYAIHRGQLGNATVRIYDEQGALEGEIMRALADRMRLPMATKRRTFYAATTQSH